MKPLRVFRSYLPAVIVVVAAAVGVVVVSVFVLALVGRRQKTDLSSVVLVSSLSSTPSKRRSGSGRWASSGHVGRSLMGQVDLGVDDLSAAHWELTEAERGLQVQDEFKTERDVGEVLMCLPRWKQPAGN